MLSSAELASLSALTYEKVLLSTVPLEDRDGDWVAVDEWFEKRINELKTKEKSR
jgi:hypothetical protein